MTTLMRTTAMLCAAVLVLPALAQESPPPADDSAAAVYRGQVDVNLVSLNVSVVDRDGAPVTGLTRNDFRILVDGEEVPITNFFASVGSSEVARPAVEDAPSEPAPAAPAADPATDATAPPATAEPAYLALVFDNASLEKRNRRRVVEALSSFLAVEMPAGTRVMIATTSPAFEVVQHFTDDRRTLMTSLDKVMATDTGGDMIKSGKRMFIRTVQSAQTVRGSWEPGGGSGFAGPRQGPGGSGGSGGTGGTGGSGSNEDPLATGGGGAPQVSLDIDEDFGTLQGSQFMAQLEAIRQQEHQRIYGALLGLDAALRGIGGMPGKKDVLWIGQDLLVNPGLDVYRTYYTKFEKWRDRLNLDLPEIWATKLSLMRQFQFIAGAAQATNTSVHVVDASDRDRDAAAADAGMSDSDSMMASDPRGTGLTGGYDMTGARDQAEGAQYVAGATGGAFFGGSRDFASFFGQLDDLLASWYSLGYVPSGPLDGSMRSVKVELTEDRSWRVRHHEKVARLSPYHRLANRAFSQLLLGETPNPIRFEATDDGQAPYEDTDKVVQSVRLVIPTAGVTMVPEGEQHVARLAVAVVAAEAEGDTSDPKLFQLPVAVPSDRLETASKAATGFRLVLEPGTQALAIAVRDEVSGVVGSVTLPVQ